MANWTSNRFTPVSIDGSWGANTTRALQFGLGGLTVDGVFGKNTVEALQRFLGGLTVDGDFGHLTARKLQARLGVTVDGIFGYASTVALQKALNAGTLGGAVNPSPGPAPASHGGRVSILESAVTYGHYSGGGSIDSWITSALHVLGWPDTAAWHAGYRTLCSRESSDNPNSVNNYDSNNTGPVQSDGNRLNDSRGVAQCIPGTFSSYHAAGSSNDIYDPVANIAASMIYVAVRYGVKSDGSNLASNVQQADASRSPRGY